MALGHISSKAVGTDTEDTSRAIECRKFWDVALRTTLENVAWKFATVRSTLSLTGTAPDEWEYQYSVPADMVMDIKIYDPLAGDNPIEYEIAKHPTAAGRVIQTNQEDAILIHTTYVDDVSLYPYQFSLALSYMLASLIAMPITSDVQKGVAASENYQRIISRAQSTNANKGERREAIDAPWIAARA